MQIGRLTPRTGHGRRNPKRMALVGLAILPMILAACGGTSDAPQAGPTPPPATGGGGGAPPVDNTVYTISVGHVLAPTEAIHLELLETAERLKDRSGGRLILEIFPSSTLGTNVELVEQAVAGANVIAHTDPGLLANNGVPDFTILNGPFLFEDTDEISKLLDSDLFRSWTDKALADGGLVVLGFNWYFGQRHIIAKRGFPNPSDMTGVLMRVPPNPVWIETFSVLPSVPTEVAFAEVYSGLQQGVIDAAEAPLGTLQGASLYEVADTITLTGHFKAVTGFVIGQKYWETLPADLQELIREEFEIGGDLVTLATVANEPRIQAELEALGVTFVEADVKAYADAVKPFYGRFPQWSDGLYDRVQAVLAGR
jgi:TRAP-type C4-dicarboxylate transport system substrate-binding protein